MPRGAAENHQGKSGAGGDGAVSLVDLIRGKSLPAKFATATPAIFATQQAAKRAKGEKGRAVASVATVAVANPGKSIPEPIPATPAKAGGGDPATASYWWLIHYPDRHSVQVAYCPDVTHAEILAWHPNAVAAEPFTPAIRQPSAPLTAKEETAIRAWLALIEETDPVSVAEVVSKCQRDADARDYFTGLAASELPKHDTSPDDRRTCEQCANLVARQCQAAKRGEIVASRDYQPIRDLLRRCEGYVPGVNDPDRRHGRERWPGLIQKGGK
jgi:hypothetical protein